MSADSVYSVTVPDSPPTRSPLGAVARRGPPARREANGFPRQPASSSPPTTRVGRLAIPSRQGYNHTTLIVAKPSASQTCVNVRRRSRTELLNIDAETDDVAECGLQNTFVIIPVLNEESSIAHVLADLPPVRQVVVVDNGSTDNSPFVARDHGALVIRETQRGYGKACLAGIAYVDTQVENMTRDVAASTIVAFLDGDYSDDPTEIVELIRPIANQEADFVVGSRSAGNREQGAMHVQAIFGNWLACSLMRLFWNARYSDLGPFRAIRYASLKSLEMRDEDFGWTIEMQIKAFSRGLRCQEIPVSYRRRIGVSKISGTLSGTFKAGYKILYTVVKYKFAGAHDRRP